MVENFNERHRYGSAAWAGRDDLARAGLFGKTGLQIGYFGQTPLRIDSDAPIITIGGAGSGKLRDQLAYVICNSPRMPMLVLDPRGEMGAISIHVHAHYGDYAYFWNPLGLCGLPSHGCNPLDILTPRSPHLHADCKFIAEGLVPLFPGGNGRYFELRAREWIENLIKSLLEQNGVVTFPALYEIVNAIESDAGRWAAMLEAMLASHHGDVVRTAGEILYKQQEAPREFGSIMGEIYAHLNFLADPVLLAALDKPAFSLAELCSDERASKIFLNVPAEYLSIWSPLLRVFFTTAMLYKSRRPQARRVTLVCDEAGQLGAFETLLRSFTYGRGAGVRAWAAFQDAGQIVRNFGAAALQGFLGSAETRIFFGVRDYQTAELVSNMLGDETLEYDDLRHQDIHRNRQRRAAQEVLLGADPFEMAREHAHHARQSTMRSAQRRRLMTPDEILSLPEDRQILFIAGRNLKPVLAHKYPYFTRREMAGRYLSNPYHPPADRVRIATRFGHKWARVLNAPVPPELALYPQHASGRMAYVEGHKLF